MSAVLAGVIDEQLGAGDGRASGDSEVLTLAIFSPAGAILASERLFHRYASCLLGETPSLYPAPDRSRLDRPVRFYKELIEEMASRVRRRCRRLGNASLRSPG